MSSTINGVPIGDMPDLGSVNDNSSVVGEHAGSGRFSAPALRSYVLTGLNLAGLPQAQPGGLPPVGAVTGDVFINGGFLCIAP